MNPQQLTMQQIADLAGVQRPVVSMWRTRYANGETAFPAPLSTSSPSTFDADEIAEWLKESGRGNNTQASDDALLHSSLFLDAVADADRFAPLLLAQSLINDEISPETVMDVPLAAAERGVRVDMDKLFELVGDSESVDGANALANAAYSGSAALAKMADFEFSPSGRFASDSLTPRGSTLLGAVTAECLRSLPQCTLTLRNLGAFALAHTALSHLAEHELPALALPERPLAPVPSAWFAQLARGARQTDDPHGTQLHVWANVNATLADAPGVFVELTDLLYDLDSSDAALVIAPAALLIDALDEPLRSARKVLVSRPHFPARYIARLPKGLTATGGRRQLALMVVQPHESRTHNDALRSDLTASARAITVFGEHSSHDFSDAERAKIAGDVVACMTGQSQVRSFLRSHQIFTDLLAGRSALAIEDALHRPTDGGKALARVWELEQQVDPSVLDGIRFAQKHRSIPRQAVPWTTLTGQYVRVIAGTRGLDEFVHDEPSGLEVIGEADVRGEVAVASRRVDQLQLVQAAPKSQRTRKGDVIFVSRGKPAAIVDRHGGRVVLAPARILRAKRDMSDEYSPHILAQEICAQQSGEVTSWHVRLAPEAEDVASALSTRLGRRRDALLAELQALEELQRTVANGLAGGVLKQVRDD